MANKFSSMKDTNPLYSHYKEVLTDAGWLEPETVSGTTGTLTAPPVVEPYTPASSKLRLSNTGNHTTQKATSGQTSNTSTGMPYSNERQRDRDPADEHGRVGRRDRQSNAERRILRRM